MNQKGFTIAIMLGVAVTVISVVAPPLVYAQDSSEADKEINNNQRGAASGESKNNFCANIVTGSGNGDTPIDVGDCSQDLPL